MLAGAILLAGATTTLTSAQEPDDLPPKPPIELEEELVEEGPTVYPVPVGEYGYPPTKWTVLWWVQYHQGCGVSTLYYGENRFATDNLFKVDNAYYDAFVQVIGSIALRSPEILADGVSWMDVSGTLRAGTIPYSKSSSLLSARWEGFASTALPGAMVARTLHESGFDTWLSRFNLVGYAPYANAVINVTLYAHDYFVDGACEDTEEGLEPDTTPTKEGDLPEDIQLPLPPEPSN